MTNKMSKLEFNHQITRLGQNYFDWFVRKALNKEQDWWQRIAGEMREEEMNIKITKMKLRGRE